MTEKSLDHLSDDQLHHIVSNVDKNVVDASIAMDTLAARSLNKRELLPAVCQLISQHNQIGVHTGPPIGWFAADQLYLSGQHTAIATLLSEMNNWQADAQEDLVSHWAGKRQLSTLTQRLADEYGWQPKYSY